MRGWDYTRHIMAAMGAGKGNPKKVMKLPSDSVGPRPNAPTKEEQKEILSSLLKYLPNRN